MSSNHTLVPESKAPAVLQNWRRFASWDAPRRPVMPLMHVFKARPPCKCVSYFRVENREGLRTIQRVHDSDARSEYRCVGLERQDGRRRDYRQRDEDCERRKSAADAEGRRRPECLVKNGAPARFERDSWFVARRSFGRAAMGAALGLVKILAERVGFAVIVSRRFATSRR